MVKGTIGGMEFALHFAHFCAALDCFCAALDCLLYLITRENKNIFILGDININLLDFDSSQFTEYSSCFQSHGFESLINLPTRCVNNENGSAIDHALSNVFSPPEAFIVRNTITDHYPVGLLFNRTKPARSTQFLKSVFNKQQFTNLINNADWSPVIGSSDAQVAYSKFSHIITEFIDSCTTSTLQRKNNFSPVNPWLTQGLLTSLRKKDNLYRKTKRQPYNLQLKARYKKYSNLLTNLLKKAKRNFYENKILHTGNNTAKQWRVLNSFLNSQCKTEISEIRHGSSTCSNPSDIANAFSSFFSETSSLSTSTHIVNNIARASHSFFLYPATPVEVRATISNLKNTSPGHDKIHATCIKENVDAISDIFTHVVNLIFKSGVFPRELKKSLITPVFKKGDKALMNNYRPISILPFFSKVIEKIVEKRLSSYLNKFNLLTPRQFGFRPGLSTNLALIALTDYIKLEIDNGKFVGGIFIDFTKAFDTINHDILFSKLALYGINGPPLQLLRNFLLNREQIINISGTLSDTKTTNLGVPQGSILGPLLFLLYINDLPSCLKLSNCLLYADDTTIYSSHSSIDVLTRNLNIDISNICSWSQSNGLIINPSKTKFVVFSSRLMPLTSFAPIYINSDAIPPSDHCSFLGVELDSSLKFINHINSLKKKMAYGIRVLIKARNYFRLPTLLTLYYAFIYSHINYCISSWGLTYDIHLTPLKRIQNQAIRIITFSSFNSHVTYLYQHLDLLPLDQLILYNLGITAHRLVTDKSVLFIIGRTDLTNHNITRFASQHNFLLPKVRTNYGKQTVGFAAIKFWNNLPINTKKNKLNRSSYKQSVLKFILEDPNFSLD